MRGRQYGFGSPGTVWRLFSPSSEVPTVKLKRGCCFGKSVLASSANEGLPSSAARTLSTCDALRWTRVSCHVRVSPLGARGTCGGRAGKEQLMLSE